MIESYLRLVYAILRSPDLPWRSGDIEGSRPMGNVAAAPRDSDLEAGEALLLPQDRSRWPKAARLAHRELLGELDRWCRQHDWPTVANTMIAERAVREVWTE
jgi:hypothetical protein